MVDMVATEELLGLIERLPEPRLFLRETFFKNELFSDKATVSFDKILECSNTIAPLVLPVNDPQLMRRSGNAVTSIQPAYLQYTHQIKPSDMMNRRAGEKLLGSLSPQQRKDLEILDLLQLHLRMKEVRLEYMASEALQSGIVTLANETEQGAKSPTEVMNFQRLSTLTPAPLTGTARWWTGTAVGSTSDPLQNIQDLIDLMAKETGAIADILIVGSNAWKGLYKNTEFRDLLSKDKGLSSIQADLSPSVNHGASYKGSLSSNDIEIWQYTNWWANNAGTKTPFIDPNKIILIDSKSIEGNVLYGAIQDNSSLIPTQLYTKEIFDGKYQKGTELFSQSAPLIFPTRINSTACLTVA
jgi:hypothetical protein